MTTQIFDDGSTLTIDDDTGETYFTPAPEQQRAFLSGMDIENAVSGAGVAGATGGRYGTTTYDAGLLSTGDLATANNMIKNLMAGKVTSQDFLTFAQQNPSGIAGVLGGLMNMGNQPQYNRVGYQGTIPQLTATRAQVPYEYDPNRRPGSGGRQYFTDVRYTTQAPEAVQAAQKSAAEQAKVLAEQPQKVPVKAAHGGLMALAKGRYLQGSTDGMADDIAAEIDGEQPAALSHGEFVVPADVVSHLGNGNSDAGAKKLYQMMDKIRMARTGTKQQGKQINPDKYMPGGSVGYASGGGIKGYAAGDLVDSSNLSRNVYESNLSSWAGPYVTGMLGKGQALSEMPYQAYQGPLTAGTSGLQQQAFETAGGLQTPAAVNQAAQTAGTIAGQMQGLKYAPSTFTSPYQAPGAYQAGTFDTGIFGSKEAQQYMNPYLQASLDPQIAEARRQAQITNLANMSKMTQAGAYGGGRQAIMQSEADRNLASNLANITGQGYNTAYQQAMAQFNADQQRKQAAQTAAEQSRQFGYGQQANAAQLAAQYGLSAQQAQEAAKQFGASYGLQGLQGALQAAQAQGALGAQQSQIGLQNLAQQAALGQQQRGIEAEGIAADKAQFEEARDYPYKMVQYQQSLLSGLPLQTQAPITPVSSNLSTFSQGATGLMDLLAKLGIK